MVREYGEGQNMVRDVASNASTADTLLPWHPQTS
jgi:hypothetical protein